VSIPAATPGGGGNGKRGPFMIKLEKELWHRKISQEGVGAGMRQTFWKRDGWVWFGMVIAFLAVMAMPPTLRAAQTTTVHVEVKDAKSCEPIYQAHLTLRYLVPGRFMRRSKVISYTSKTDKNGKSKFPVVPMGTVTLMVTAPHHNTFGKEFEITKENQVIEVKLQQPHPVL
jgi:hypothetical protein